MQFFRVLSALTLVMTMAASAAAQTSRGSQRVTGKVLDEAGRPIVGAQVSAAKKGEVKPDVFTATTNEKGEYSLNGLAAGDWVIEAKKDGTGAVQVGASLVEGERTKNVDLTIAKAAPAATAAPDPSVEIGAGLDQEMDHVDVAVHHSQHQRGQAVLGRVIQGGATIDQEPDHAGATVARGVHERGLPVLVARVDVRARIEQALDRFQVTAVD